MEYTVYLRTNTVNNKQYVGQTSDFKRRERDWRCLKNCYANEYLSNDREKYGFDAWTVKVLVECDSREEAWELEQRFINDYNTLWPNGYNLAKGGAGVKGCKPSEETKQKISEALKGTHHSEETKQKMSEANKGENNPMFGIHHTGKTKQKISETLKKISEAKKIPVYQYTLDGKLVAIWPSATDAEEKLGIKRSSISACCNGKRKTAGGYIWSFNLLNNNHEASNLAS